VNQGSNEIYNPDAYQFLVNANIFNINPHRVRNFYQRVVYHKSEKLYQADGYHTFFIPVEEGFKVEWKIEKKSLFCESLNDFYGFFYSHHPDRS
jgi:hypothetical protein